MLTNEKAHFWSGGISRSMSEGNLFDMEARKSSRNCDITECPDPGLPLDWPEDFTLHGNNASSATNPFWNGLSASNPFLDDITQLRNNQKRAYVLGYSHLALEDFDQLQADKESEKVAYVVKKLKEDCHADRNTRKFLYELTVALLKIDCQGLVVHLVQEAAILTSAVKLGKGWRELAEKLVRLTKRQMEAYEIPHQGKSGDVAVEMMWKPAYDFLYTWSAHYGNSYRDVLQDLQSALDRMKNPVTKQWRDLTGALILVNSLEVLRATAFSTCEEV